MNVAVPKEVAPGERRVAVTPDVAARLIKTGATVLVEHDAGAAAGFLDEAYEAAGCAIVADAKELFSRADIILKVQRPLRDQSLDVDECARMRPGTALIALLAPLVNVETVRALADRGITTFSMDAIPRISRAQGMDVLSSQSTVAGYKAVLLGADALPKFFPMLMTAAGTVAPAKVLILGAGVAGLQAIATARRLGAVVSGFDTRPAVKEQVESLGAAFVAAPVHPDGEAAGGYAKELSAETQAKERELIAKHVAESDVVITTALVPGKQAPLLITASMVQAMRPGSVIVDLAAEAGGNCELSQPGKTAVMHDVTILAPFNVPSSMPLHASQLYAKNVLALFNHLVRDGGLQIDMSDEITRSVCITRDGQIVNEAVRALVGGGTA
ncbi:MAG: Re/Si-specific NAD(P)(+) transhydrogenase subunit alpha [Candidatus Eremiobacteraeota bacterium]|nr:Re/Si-specific NAD(P)(+) transhydrogenase subunit alpha [Candidatus Eremiobacteraeota bacterium]MBC5826132.1 Re/Si-specific NAD(P)(+) transhydrogenase subunit alpha [Candidatus Eremiobacteraeota bacterium]